MNRIILVCLLLLPFAAGITLAFLKKAGKRTADRVFLAALSAQALLTIWYLFLPDASVPLFSLTDKLHVSLRTDGISRIFLTIGSLGFLLSGIYAVRYMEHGGMQAQFYAFMLLSLGAVVGMDISQNLITMYLFFEFITLLSMPLVLHDRSEESIRAALKYLFFSIGGAFLALLAIFILAKHTVSLDFAAGGTLNNDAAREYVADGFRAAHAQEIFHLGRHDVIANCVSETGGDTICTDGFADRHDRCGEDGGQNERQRDALQNLRLARTLDFAHFLKLGIDRTERSGDHDV